MAGEEIYVADQAKRRRSKTGMYNCALRRRMEIVLRVDPGCFTCRARKVRCDEQHPICRTCNRLRLSCSYTAPGQPELISHKNARPHHSRFRVRFVDSTPTTTPTKPQRSSRTVARAPPEVDHSPQNVPTPPATETSCTDSRRSSQDSLFNSGDWSCRIAPRLELVDTSSVQWPSKDGAMMRFPAKETCSTKVGAVHPSGAEEGMFDSVNLQTDVDLLRNSIPVFDDFEDLRIHGVPHDSVTEAIDRTPLALSPSTSRSPSLWSPRALEAPKKVIIRPEDQEPLQHYLSTMIQFAKIRSSATDHIYCHIFSNMALNHAPLYEALLAWSALHLAHVRSSSTADSEARYKRAAELLCDDSHAGVHLDVTLSTVWIMLQYEMTAAETVDKFIRLLDYAADVVEGIFERHGSSVREQLGPVGMRVLMWLCAFEGRAAPFGSSCRLLRCLKLNSSIYDDIEDHGTTNGPVNQAISSIEFGTVELKAQLRLALRLYIFKGSCVLLGTRSDDSASEYQAAWTALHSSLVILQR